MAVEAAMSNCVIFLARNLLKQIRCILAHLGIITWAKGICSAQNRKGARMKNIAKTNASQQYAAAHELHYIAKDLNGALTLYKSLVEEYHETLEAEYARTQIHHIVNSVVSADEMLKLQIAIAFAHLKRRGTGSVSVTPMDQIADDESAG